MFMRRIVIGTLDAKSNIGRRRRTVKKRVRWTSSQRWRWTALKIVVELPSFVKIFYEPLRCMSVRIIDVQSRAGRHLPANNARRLQFDRRNNFQRISSWKGLGAPAKAWLLHVTLHGFCEGILRLRIRPACQYFQAVLRRVRFAARL